MSAPRASGAGAVDDLVSVIIPCYNQAGYLPDAVGSALRQAYGRVEVVVVDDGSSEDVRAVVNAWPGVQYVRQRNRGVASARNNGFLHSRGAYVVFLDSDDRLARHGITDGLDQLRRMPEAGAAVGLSRIIGPHGEPLPFGQQGIIDGDPYRELLRANFIWMPAQVLYRRRTFESIGGFDRRVDACADYDLYLRMARRFRLAVHRSVVADYRQHGANMSGDAALMLRSAVRVLERQRPYVANNASYQQAFAAGQRFWREYYAEGVIEQIRRHARMRGARRVMVRSAWILLRYHPSVFATHLRRNLLRLASPLLPREPTKTL